MSGETDRQHLVVAPDGTRYAVPSGTHERLRRVVVSTVTGPDGDAGEADGRLLDTDDPERVASESDPKVALALAGWTTLQTDGMTDRLYVDAPDDGCASAAVEQFAAAHDTGRVTIAFHPSGRVVRRSDPTELSG